MAIEQAPIKKKTILARVTLYDADGNTDRSFSFVPMVVGRNAHLTEHPDHLALRSRIIEYFGLNPEVDEWEPARPSRWKKPETTNDPNHPVMWASGLKVPTGESWQIILTSYDPRTGGTRVAYHEDENGALAKQIREEREIKMAEAKEAAATRRAKSSDNGEGKPEKAPRVLRPKDVKVSDLPVDIKPINIILPNGDDHEVKVFAKTWREKKEGNKRVRDEDTPREAKDDSFTFAATAYQIEPIQAIYHHPQGIIIIGQKGAGVLQTIRHTDKDEMAKVVEAAEKHGFKGKVEALPKK